MHPTTFAEYQERTQKNTVITGFGLEVKTVYPCPFCAAPNFMSCLLLDTKKEMQRDHGCTECGRSAKAILHKDNDSETAFEMVQTGGDEQPAYFTRKMRRV